VLRAAALSAAEAMERTAEFGRVAVGLRADLLLLDANPRDGLATLHHPAGVMAHGCGWIGRRWMRCWPASGSLSRGGRGSHADAPGAAQ
jgi:cytosine/adenosine deaminase-related metal-dependent hydrolase